MYSFVRRTATDTKKEETPAIGTPIEAPTPVTDKAVPTANPLAPAKTSNIEMIFFVYLKI